jgi:tetratricopeptide (TPR) repeat protein
VTRFLLLVRSLLLGALVFPPVGGCGYFTSADDRARHAEELLGKGKYNEAAIELRNAIDAAPRDARIKLLFARAALQLGSADAAGKALEEAGRAGADPAGVAALRAQYLLDVGRPGELLAILDGKAAALDAATRISWRARALGALDRCDEAIPLAREGLALHSDVSALRIVVAECYARHRAITRALEELAAGARDAPRDAAIAVAQGQLLSISGKKKDAEQAWQRAFELAPGQLSAPQITVLLLSQAELQAQRGDAAALRVTHERLLEVAPQAPATELVGALWNMQQGEIETAVTTLRKLRTSAPKLTAVPTLLAAAYLKQGSLEQARRELGLLGQQAPALANVHKSIEMLNLLTKAAPASEEYWLRTGAIYALLGQPAFARQSVAEAAAKAPDSLRPGLFEIELELRVGDAAVALQRAASLAARHPEAAAAMAAHAEALGANARYADAASIYQKLYSRAPGATLALALHRVRVVGGLPEADAPLVDWLSRTPGDVSIRGAYADAMRIAGNNRGAIEEYAKVLELAPQNVAALNNYAWLLHLVGDERALPVAERAAKLAPGSPQVADTYGWLLVEAGELDRGLELLEKADAAAGLSQPEVRFHHAAALARAGQRDTAKRILGQLVQEWPAAAIHADAARLLSALGQPTGT